jgi:hypothetical protein
MGDDWTEIIVKRHIARRVIGTLERTFEDDDLLVVHHHRNGLDGKVSSVVLVVP